MATSKKDIAAMIKNQMPNQLGMDERAAFAMIFSRIPIAPTIPQKIFKLEMDESETINGLKPVIPLGWYFPTGDVKRKSPDYP